MSSTTSPITRYHGVAILLHWLLAAALIGIFVLGSYMTDLPFSPQRLQLYSWHKWAGVVILLLSALLLFWRLTHRPPALPAQIEQAMPRWQAIAHHATHHGLYLLFFAVPLIGWAYSSAAGFPIVLFGVLPLPDFVPVSPELAEFIKPWHELSAVAMLLLAGLHVAGALKHVVIDRDGLLQRMWFGR